MNQWARGFFGRPIIDDWIAAARLHDEDLSRARAPPRRPARRHADGAGFSASIVDATLYIVNNHRQLRTAGASLVLYLPKIQTAEEAALWNDMLSALEQHLGSSGRHDQGLRARRADRGVFPVDGDPRRPRHALRRLQHRPLGLHQQRLRCDGVGPGVRQPEHRRHHDDLRLHAELRGPRAARRATRPTGWASTRSGRAAWSRTSRSDRKPASRAA